MIATYATLLTITVALVGASPMALTQGEIAQDKRQMYKFCDDDAWKVEHGTILSGTCRADDGLIRPESIDLNQCLGNANGKLVHLPGGGYANSCDTSPGAHHFSSGTTVCTYCTAGDGSSSETCIAIDDFASVNDGRLTCRG
ncbi:uncharacterized protein B0I36DRAFT_369851 [Microdochium trichocladiopsis]|uniref:Cyanovirin-N domain-containing protein n=1 Tax=Microdochium trichocladiopsis TaxID=1682393 RepID=A0A9P8XRP8_9PEZI|nr:uncharacterized protein B0I36DRAFT_369851 [Microdochium trichocladiopsis]KAH7012738.1 hypothetical protein B0I36DRAFT_369851 [Microdochium trichocladiopsis]